MHHSLISEQNQTVNAEKVSIFSNFFSEFKVGSLLNQSGIRKTKGAAPLAVFTIVFNLAFIGKNFFQGVIKNETITIGKDAVYNFLNSNTYNWRRFTLLLSVRIYTLIQSLLDDSSEEVLIFDETVYPRNRSKKVELLARVRDHSKGQYIKGFRALGLAWSDGISTLGLDFALLSSADKKHRYNGITKSVDKRTCGYKRRIEATSKSTDLMAPMLKRALGMGIRAKYLLLDSWFSAPPVIATLRQHIHIICMLKDVPNWRYEYDGKKLRLRDLYGKLKKKRGNARIKASAVVRLSNGEEARIIFVPSEKKRRWLAILSTDKELAEEEIVRLYGKRWDIEVFFKMCKQHLKLADEIQIRDFDGLIAHTSMVFARYNILSWFQRQQTDGRTFGGMFRICCKEMENIKFIDALSRIMQIAMAVMQGAGKIPEKVLESIMSTVMGIAIAFFGFSGDKSNLLSEA